MELFYFLWFEVSEDMLKEKLKTSKKILKNYYKLFNILGFYLLANCELKKKIENIRIRA